MCSQRSWLTQNDDDGDLQQRLAMRPHQYLGCGCWASCVDGVEAEGKGMTFCRGLK
jgi:hypothetical protein